MPTPNTPSGLRAYPVDGGSLVGWDAPRPPDGDIDYYNIKWGTTQGGPYSNVVNAGNPDTVISPYSLTGLTNGVPHYMVLSVVNTFATESSNSYEIKITPRDFDPTELVP